MTTPLSPSSPRPDHLAAAEAARSQGDHAAAEAHYQAALAAGQGNPAVHYNLGTYCAQRGDWAGACEYFKTAVAAAPDFALAWYNLGSSQRQLNQLPAARSALARALELAPDLHAARVNLSLVDFALGDSESALRLAHAALEAHPDDPDVFANLSTYLRTLGALEEAKLCAESALRLQPTHAGAWQALGTLAQDQRAFAAAVTCYRHAIENDPDNAAAHWNLGLAALAQGDFDLGWREYEWRTRLPQMRGHYPDFGLPLWQGEASQPLAGKTLLLVAEQGHGDTLQFVRLARQVKAAGACVKLMAQPALLRLLRPLPWLDAVVAQTDPPPAADYVLPLLSLPARLGLQLADLPGAIPYLAASAENLAAWRQRLADLPSAEDCEKPRPRIGLVWSGDPRPHDPESHRIDARRSLPLAQLAPLFAAAPEYAWFSLQKGSAASQATAWPQLLDYSAEWQDFADTAALVAQLDLVITVDTAMAHLSAALGKPTWVLSRFDACWRWLDERSDSPWYPGLRLFRQPSPGDWATPLAELATALGEYFAAPAPTASGT
ncbi:tetratricopeptide repeat protein [Dechloromonas sp. ZY10]|uniref:tetratricopeptide repeat protein n=1 Tax=Dechloromonas aquae TaxID=2664436 RepID=UPI0035285483